MPSSKDFELIGPNGEPVSRRQMNTPSLGNNLKMQQMREHQQMIGQFDHLQNKKKPTKNKKHIAMKIAEGIAEGFSSF
jgi:hypothetical protein